MTKPLIINYLQSGKTYSDLLTEHGVHAKPYNSRVSFTYDMIEAKQSNQLACQCRGLILRENTWEILARPFDRFFNFGEGFAAKIDWDSAHAEEKLDGTLLIVYFDGKWLSATRSCSEAQGELPCGGISFAQLADEAAGGSINDLMKSEDINYTYLFELTAPHNQIVVKYNIPKLTLLGVREIQTGIELRPENTSIGKKVGVPEYYSWNNPADIKKAMQDWSPVDHEGVVVVDKNFNRIKIKTDQYLAAAHCKDSLESSWRRAIELVLLGHADDMKSVLPEFVVERIETAENKLRELFEETEKDFARINITDNMKEFASLAKKCRWSAALFQMKRENITVLDFAKGIHTDHLLRLLGLK